MADHAGRIATAGVVLAMAAATVTLGFSSALFTETESLGGNTFTTGTVDLSTSPTSALVSAGALAPGGITEGALTVTNSGTLQLRYAIQGHGTDADAKDLRGNLRIRIALKGGVACDFPYYTANGSTTLVVDDTQLYEGLGLTGTPANLVGSAASGAQAGDRTLAASAAEDLCVSVVLPSSAGNALQNATSTLTFDFVSEQTANN